MLSHHSLWTQSPRIWSGSQLGKPSPPGAPTLGDSQPWPLRPPTVRARPEPPRGSRERTSPPNRPTAAAPQRRRPTVAPWRRGEAARQRPPVRTALPPAVPRPGTCSPRWGTGSPSQPGPAAAGGLWPRPRARAARSRALRPSRHRSGHSPAGRPRPHGAALPPPARLCEAPALARQRPALKAPQSYCFLPV